MKIWLLTVTLGMLARSIGFLPPATLPQYPVRGTLKLEKKQEELVVPLERGMSYKMHYLKTGHLINTVMNQKKQQNFWGKGVPARVQFPSHLAEWEEFRRTKPKVNIASSRIAH